MYSCIIILFAIHKRKEVHGLKEGHKLQRKRQHVIVTNRVKDVRKINRETKGNINN